MSKTEWTKKIIIIVIGSIIAASVSYTHLKLPDAHSPVCLSNEIDENTHLQSDAEPVTKALSLQLSYRQQYRKQVFR